MKSQTKNALDVTNSNNTLVESEEKTLSETNLPNFEDAFPDDVPSIKDLTPSQERLIREKMEFQDRSQDRNLKYIDRQENRKYTIALLSIGGFVLVLVTSSLLFLLGIHWGVDPSLMKEFSAMLIGSLSPILSGIIFYFFGLNAQKTK